MAECLSGLTPEEFAVITNPSTGIATVSKYLPSVADIHEFLRKEQARHEQFKPAHTTYKKLEPDGFPEGYDRDKESRKAFVSRLQLHKQFPEGAHLKPPIERVLFEGEPTERQLNPNTKFETPKEFPAHLWNTDFIQGRTA